MADAPAPDDVALLRILREGDTHAAQDAFDALFRSWYARLVQVAERVTRDRAVAEEVVQDVLFALWRRRATLPADTPAGPYLLRAVRNRALNHRRHVEVERRTAAVQVADVQPAVAPGQVVGDEVAAAVQRAVDQLPPRCREVFVLSRVRGLRRDDIAALLGVTVKAVEAQVTRALRLLRVELDPWLHEEASR